MSINISNIRPVGYSSATPNQIVEFKLPSAVPQKYGVSKLAFIDFICSRPALNPSSLTWLISLAVFWEYQD
jgi:hypothetical protein